MDILSTPVCTETVIKKSRFISELLPCENQVGARELIKKQKQKYADATHVVHAFVIGPQGGILGMSDDGEPSGTAGHPILDVLKGRRCTNTLLTVIRYFGGTLLGTGGLVKAYGGCAKSVIEYADERRAFVPLVMKISFSYNVSYPLYESINRCLSTFDIYELNEQFSESVTVSGKIRFDEADRFAALIFDMTGGKTTLVLGTN